MFLHGYHPENCLIRYPSASVVSSTNESYDSFYLSEEQSRLEYENYPASGYYDEEDNIHSTVEGSISIANTLSRAGSSSLPKIPSIKITNNSESGVEVALSQVSLGETTASKGKSVHRITPRENKSRRPTQTRGLQAVRLPMQVPGR